MIAVVVEKYPYGFEAKTCVIIIIMRADKYPYGFTVVAEKYPYGFGGGREETKRRRKEQK